MTDTPADEDVLAVDASVNFAEGDVRIQIKCTSGWTIDGGSLTFPLEESWVKKWDRCKGPVYLVVVIVGDEPDDWLRHEHNGTFHEAAAFWVRIPKKPGTSIQVPKGQRLTKETLAAWNKDLLAMYTPGGEP